MFTLLGYTSGKALRKTLIKLTPVVGLVYAIDPEAPSLIQLRLYFDNFHLLYWIRS